MQEFRKPENKRDRFLQKRKQEKSQLEANAKRIADSIRVQAVIRTVLARRRVLKSIVQQAESHMPMVIVKKQQSSEEKFAKIMSNAVYKMPFFFQALLYINYTNYPLHRKYLSELVQCLSTKLDSNWPVIGTILHKKGFPQAGLQKLLTFAIQFLNRSADQNFEGFIQAYLKQCEVKHMSDRMERIISQSELARHVMLLILEDRISLETQRTLMTHGLLQYPNSFFFLSHDDCIRLCLKFPFALTPELVAAQNLTQPKVSPNFLQTYDVDIALMYYRQATTLLRLYLNPQNFNIARIGFVLFMVEITLQRYRDAIKGEVYARLYKKRNLIETSQNQEDLYEIWSRSAEYTKFIKTIDIELYTGELFKMMIGVIDQMSEVNSQKLNLNHLFDSLTSVFLIILEVLRQDFTKVEAMRSKELIKILYRILTENENRNEGTKQHRRARPLSLFILLLSRQFSLMDDYEFVNETMSYNKESMYNIIMLTLRVVHELTLEGRNPHNQMIFDAAIKLINNIYQKNFRTKYFDPNIFQSRQLKGYDEKEWNFKNMMRQLEYTPFIVKLQTRYGIFQQLQKEARIEHHRGRVTIRRGHYFEDSFRALADTNIHGYEFYFMDETGREQEAIDGGGPTKEFINRVCKEMFHPKSDFFLQTANKDVVLNPFSRRSLKEFQFTGKLIGKAIFQKIAIQFRLSGILLNIILGNKNTLEDLQYLDRQIYNNLMKVKHSSVEGLDLNFTVSDTYTDKKGKKQTKVTELREFGSMIPVTEENKMQFIMDYSDYKMNKLGQEQSKAFKKGFTQLVNSEYLKLFNHDELNKIISGMKTEIDFTDLRKYVIYQNYLNTDDTIVIFWQVLNELTPNQKQKFLMFVTACSRPPLFGFKELKPPIRIIKTPDPKKLPTSHTCGNILELPDYKTPEILREKLLLAIQHDTGYGFA